MTGPSDSSRLKKRSVRIGGHRTSVSLEGAFWAELSRLAGARKMSLNRLIAVVDSARTGNLSSALRLYVLDALRGEIKS